MENALCAHKVEARRSPCMGQRDSDNLKPDYSREMLSGCMLGFILDTDFTGLKIERI